MTSEYNNKPIEMDGCHTGTVSPPINFRPISIGIFELQMHTDEHRYFLVRCICGSSCQTGSLKKQPTGYAHAAWYEIREMENDEANLSWHTKKNYAIKNRECQKRYLRKKVTSEKLRITKQHVAKRETSFSWFFYENDKKQFRPIFPR